MTGLEHCASCAMAPGLLADKFKPFSRQKSIARLPDCFNCNLPPETQSQQEKIIILGVIPGPKKPIDVDSFIFPGREEFGQSSCGP
jgi:hypothetical protein